MVGLSWAFFIAGTPSTIVSQWKVESASTTRLMIEFHRALRTAKTTKAQALQTVARIMISSARASPFFLLGGLHSGGRRYVVGAHDAAQAET